VLKSDETDLFSPVKLGELELANRIAMAPLTRGRATSDGVLSEYHAIYYGQRASAGLIISEATNISPEGRGYAYTPGIWSEKQIAAWKTVTKAVHDKGGKIVCQLWHVGRFSHSSLQPSGVEPVAPSAIRADGKTYTENGFEEVSTPRALRTDEIQQVIEQYSHAAHGAKRAGFDGVEIHSANCFLLDQFIRDSTNHRTDAYGGSVENRCRLPIEVVEAAAAIWGAGRVGIRLSPTTNEAGNTPCDSNVMQTYGYLITRLSQYQLAYLHLIEGHTFGSRVLPENVCLQTLRRSFSGPYVANNGYTLEMAREARQTGAADVIAFGRPFIGNPDLVERFRLGLQITHASETTWYGGGAAGFIDWPNYGQNQADYLDRPHVSDEVHKSISR
jgi:N-ethylmaleimide reductase